VEGSLKSLREKVSKSWAKCEEAQREMEILFSGGLYSGSVSRAYYAMFYATTALLFTKNLEFSKHSGTISAFGKQFIKTGLLEDEYHKLLTESFKARQSAEYNIFRQIDKEFAAKINGDAKRFVSRIKRYLKENKWL